MDRDFLKQFLAGLFFLVSIGMVFGAVFLIGLQKGFMEPKVKMSAVFHKIGGLNAGAPVRLLGVTVGTVSDIMFLNEPIEGRTVKMDMELLKKYEKHLRRTVSIAIITEGVLGEKIVEITTDSAAERHNLAEPVIGEDPLDVQTLAETFGEAAVALLETSRTFEEISNEMETIFMTTRRLLNRVEQRIIDGTLFKVF